MSHVFRYEFAPEVDMEEVEVILVMAIFGVQALHGEADVRLDVAHAFDAAKRACVVDGSTPVGRDLNRLFVSYLERDLGEDEFEVQRVDDEPNCNWATAA